MKRSLTSTYYNLFNHLSDGNLYEVRTVKQHYCDNLGACVPEKVTVVLRVDVDRGMHLVGPLSDCLGEFGLVGSFFFITHKQKHYEYKNKEIYQNLLRRGHEVGVHTDHIFEAYQNKSSAILKFKNDVSILQKLTENKIYGSVFHGHGEIEKLGMSNWDLTKRIEPSHIGLLYHDGFTSCYHDSRHSSWKPRCDIQITDFLGLPHARGFNAYPNYVLDRLKRAKPGQIVHLCIHNHYAFEYWLDWPDTFQEERMHKGSEPSFWLKRLQIVYNLELHKLWFKPLKSLLQFLGIYRHVKRIKRKND